MSFSNLRPARQAKESKSYVKVANDGRASPFSAGGPQAAAKGSVAVSLDGLCKPPPSMEIRTSTTSGRGIWAKEIQRAGSVILSVKPHIAVLSNNSLDSHCSSCMGPAPVIGLKKCTQCRTIWYCGPMCQKNDWPLHKYECPALQKWAEEAPSSESAIPGDAIRSLGRIIWTKRKEGAGSACAREIDMMQSNRSTLHASAFELHTQLAHSLVRYLGLSSPPELAAFGFNSPGDLVDIISQFITNTFTLTSPSLTPLGTAVSPLVALFNHSCDPNAVVVFPRSSTNPSTSEPLMQVVALRDITLDEEVLTAYIDTTLPRASRQKALNETYNFSCRCRLCTSPLDVDSRESMWCPKSCGGICPLPTEDDSFTRCTKCKAVVSSTDAVLDALRIGQDALDKATSLQFKDLARAKRLTSNLIPILVSASLTPSCHPLLAMTRLHQSLLISSLPEILTQDVLDETIQIAAKAVAGMSAVLPEGHPARGIALAELGKLLAVDEPARSTPSTPAQTKFPPSGPRRLQLACETLVKARRELIIGFGVANDGGKVGMEVREAVVSLEKELGIWKQGVRNVLEDMPEKK